MNAPALSFSPGSLVSLRGREWIVQPSDNANLLLLKPLGGSDEETAGIFLPLAVKADMPCSAEFKLPEPEDIGNLSDARLLHDAARLALRNGAGPFRSIAKLSFRPRAYQMAPLVMALKQRPEENAIRLLVADDVGVGKTIEALIITRELLDRRIIRRFAVVCLPHLCEQWQQEISRKLDIEAVVIRSSTQASLDREIQGDISIFSHYPYQVISIDYIKSEDRRGTFISQCPELVIVDEAHSCARPEGAAKSQQQRHALISAIAAKPEQHLLLLTATPHSGKPEEFQSLLGLLRADFENIDLSSASETQRRNIAVHYIQRRRGDILKWASEDTPFAKRNPKEACYEMGKATAELFDDILEFARGLVTHDSNGKRRRVSYWTALALLRGVASSPAAGAAMLNARLERVQEDAFGEDDDDLNLVHDADPAFGSGFESDLSPVEIMERNIWSDPQKRKIKELRDRLEAISIPAKDNKLAAAAKIIEENIAEGFNTVVFCRYIATAKYIGEKLAVLLRKSCPGLRIETVTSDDPDDLRRKRIDEMESSAKRLLIATDCISEGINLQSLFSAALHYDLPWNPNRLEQREGRIDRYGQTAPEVRATLLHGKKSYRRCCSRCDP